MRGTFLFIGLLGFASANDAGLKITPVQKVIQLLEDMVATGVKEKQEEEVGFNKYSSWCVSEQGFKRDAIKKSNDLIESLEADIQKYEADAELLAKEISGLDVDITTWEGDSKSATKVRAIERRDYENTHKDYSESIEALDEGIAVLNKEAGDVEQAPEEEPAPAAEGASLSQLEQSPMMPEKAKQAIATFLSIGSPGDAYEAENMAIVAPSNSEAALEENARLITDASQNHDFRAADRASRSVRSSLMQLSTSKMIPAGAKTAISAFLQRAAAAQGAISSEDLQNPGTANAYESQSKGVIDMLTKLSEKFFTERETLEKNEVEALHAFGMIMQDVKNQINFATTSREEKKVAKTKSLQAAADAKGDLVDETGTRDDDMKYLADITATCEQKAESYEQRQKLRGEELKAVGQAIDIMKDGAVSGNSEKHLPQLLQVKPKALVQLQSAQNPAQLRVVSYLKAQASKYKSRVLSAIAVRASNDPFKKVKKMVKDLIVKLMEEANAEADHKGWCDMELATNEHTRTEKTSDVETLSAEIDELEASVAKLADDIAQLSNAIAELDASVAKATAIRAAEKSKNTITVTDAVSAQEAVSNAIGVLKDFYAGAEKATALLQTRKAGQPEVFDEAYKGMGGENGGVIGMMEVIQADFARLESETKSAESEAQKEFDEFSNDAKVDKAEKSKDFDHKTQKHQDHSQALVQRKADFAGTSKELESAVAYFDKLKPTCIGEAEPYEDRVARRKEEIESLQEALRILQGEDVI